MYINPYKDQYVMFKFSFKFYNGVALSLKIFAVVANKDIHFL